MSRMGALPPSRLEGDTMRDTRPLRRPRLPQLPRLPHLFALLAALFLPLGLLAPSATAASPPDATAAAGPVRIMPLGDSITGSPGCWRALLWNRLQDAGHTDIDFVGTLPPQGCGVAHDGDNEGHGGELVTNVASQGLLPARLAATLPDIAVMHFGTNDVWSNIAPDRVLAAYDTLLAQMRESNPDMRVLVAQLIPMNPATCAECAQRVVDLNARIPAWAARASTDRSPWWSSTSGRASTPPPTPTTACTPTRPGTRRSPPAGSPHSRRNWRPPRATPVIPETRMTPPSPAPRPSDHPSPSGRAATRPR